MSETIITVPTEQDELRLQIDESRAALAEKLEMLEEKVAETVQSATNSVAEATASVVDTVNNATASVSETVDSVNAAVQDTVHNVRNTVSDTVESVRQSFDLTEHVRRNPWMTLAAAVAAGFVAGRFLQRDTSRTSGITGPGRPGSSPSNDLRYDGVGRAGPDFGQSFDTAPARFTPDVTTRASATNNEATPKSNPIGDLFHSEVAKLKSLAIGVSLGLVRDAVTNSAPPALRDQLAEIVNDFTTKLGGEPFPSPVISSSPNSNVPEQRQN